MTVATTANEGDFDTASPTGASSHDSMEWHLINWHQAHREVRRLQARIVVRP